MTSLKKQPERYRTRGARASSGRFGSPQLASGENSRAQKTQNRASPSPVMGVPAHTSPTSCRLPRPSPTRQDDRSEDAAAKSGTGTENGLVGRRVFRKTVTEAGTCRDVPRRLLDLPLRRTRPRRRVFAGKGDVKSSLLTQPRSGCETPSPGSHRSSPPGARWPRGPGSRRRGRGWRVCRSRPTRTVASLSGRRRLCARPRGTDSPGAGGGPLRAAADGRTDARSLAPRGPRRGRSPDVEVGVVFLSV